MLNLLFEQPYTRITNLENAGIAKRQTASKYLKELSDLGVLNEVQIGRDKLFINLRLMIYCVAMKTLLNHLSNKKMG